MANALDSRVWDEDNEPDPLEQRALPFGEAAPIVAIRAADDIASRTDALCESCGATAQTGGLCARCRQAFEPVLDQSQDARRDHTIPTAEFDALFAALEEAQARAKSPVAPPSTPVSPLEAPTPAQGIAVAASSISSPAFGETPRAAAATALSTPIAQATEIPSAQAGEVIETPVIESKREAVSSAWVGRLRSVAAAVAIVGVVGAIGIPLGKLWLERQTFIIEQPAAAVPVRSNAAAPVLKKTAISERVALPSASPKAKAPEAAATVPPATALARVPSKAIRPARPSVPAVLASAAPAPIVEAGPVELPTSTEVVAVAPPVQVAAPEPPAGPFFEPAQVDKRPQVVSRVETHVPAALQSRAQGEIVVVRVLVTQTGRPVLISLLRPSKTGLALDEAVIAAVKQWTFTPALKRGQAVSCFVHLGVPIR